MRTSYKAAIAFAASIALFVLLQLVFPDQPAVASIPGVLLTAYVAKLCYEYFRIDKPNL